MGAKSGVIFSIDAFVAFSLILIAIYGLFVLIGTPKSYFTSLEQTSDYAHDTLLSLTRLHDSSGSNYLELIAEDYSKNRLSPSIPADAHAVVERAIPLQFGYQFEIYDSLAGGWVLIPVTYAADRSNVTYENAKLAASAQAPITFYIRRPHIGQSTWCYQTCRGYSWNGTNYHYEGRSGPGENEGNPEIFCQNAPCQVPSLSQFDIGELAVGWVRLTVFI
jgi:hypothetical protein